MKKNKSTKAKPKGVTLQTFLIKLGYQSLVSIAGDNLGILKFAAVMAIANKGGEKMMDKALEAVGVRTDKEQAIFAYRKP